MVAQGSHPPLIASRFADCAVCLYSSFQHAEKQPLVGAFLRCCVQIVHRCISRPAVTVQFSIDRDLVFRPRETRSIPVVTSVLQMIEYSTHFQREN